MISLSSLNRLIIFILLGLIVGLLALGFPRPDQSLRLEVSEYAVQIAEVFRGSDEDKNLFLTNGFCTNGTLEQLFLRSQDMLEESILVESLSRDCVVVLSSIKT